MKPLPMLIMAQNKHLISLKIYITEIASMTMEKRWKCICIMTLIISMHFGTEAIPYLEMAIANP